MGRIRILSDDVANKIAAGEVVERPASVVKELLENSLDAGASNLRVEVEAGGRSLIRITDDGCGMMRDDAMLAFERHATSKLSSPKDLLAIQTLGFRGEALPSIASVSRLVLETRAREETTGTRVEIAGGKMLSCDEAAYPPGATITVRDLFYNMPARKKFLRTEQTELAHIASLVTHYSLAHTGKDFLLRSGGRELLQVTAVPTVRERVYQVFGNDVLSGLVDLEVCERALEVTLPKPPPWVRQKEEDAEPERVTKHFRLRGFVSGPQVQKSNRNSVFLFVNRRLIRDRLLLHALSSAYHNLIPHSAYPFALLFLECDFDEVDVNVHPSKTEVRFRHQSAVHDFVRDSVRERLLRARPVSALPLPSPRPAPAPSHSESTPAPEATPSGQAAAALPYSEFTQAIENSRWMDPPGESHPAVALTGGPQAPLRDMPPFAAPESASYAPSSGAAELPEFTLRASRPPEPRLDFGSGGIPTASPRSEAAGVEEDPARFPGATLAGSTSPVPQRARSRIPDSHGAFPPELMGEPLESLDALADLRPVGQLHDSFILAAGRDGLWIVDQHVAHERILFEQVLERRSTGTLEVQQLLTPLLLELTAGQQLEYGRIAGELAGVGFETEPFGPRTVAVKSSPAGLPAAELEKLIYEILEIAESELRRVSLEDMRAAIAATIACRAAIKINTRLDTAKMEWLLKELAQTRYPMSCPHGRPIALRYSTREILKGFHRI
jgi:DNA mismatch repair protein MutL